MKLINRKALMTMISTACLLLAAQAWGAGLSLQPDTTKIGVGDLVSVDIIVDGLESIDLAAFSFHLNYDSAVLGFDSYTLGSELTADPDWEDWSDGDNGSGITELAGQSYSDDFLAQSDSFILATITFKALAFGESSLTLTDILLGDELGDPISSSATGSLISVENPVPLPSAAIFLTAGLLGLGLAGRKK